jgi:DNA mismatch repair ATPase MutL
MLNIYQIIREVLDEYISIYEEYTKYKKEYNNKLYEKKEEEVKDTTETTETTETMKKNQNTYQNSNQNTKKLPPKEKHIISFKNLDEYNKSVNSNESNKNNSSVDQNCLNNSNSSVKQNSSVDPNNSVKPNKKIIDFNKLNFIKNLYKKIAVKTHPDKTKNKIYNFYFKMSKYYYEKNILIGIIDIANKINITINFNIDGLSKNIFDEVALFKNYIFTIKNSDIYLLGKSNNL